MNIPLGHSFEHHLHRRPDLSRGGRLEVARSSGRIHVLVASDGAPRIVSGIQAVSNSDARLESFGILGHCHVIVRYNHAPSGCDIIFVFDPLTGFHWLTHKSQQCLEMRSQRKNSNWGDGNIFAGSAPNKDLHRRSRLLVTDHLFGCIYFNHLFRQFSVAKHLFSSAHFWWG